MTSSGTTEPERFPPGLQNAFWFGTFNAFSFQIVLSSPMFLYARHLDAGATVLGLIAGMMPLLVILQIFAAPYVARVGYKRFVYGGWSIRVMFIGLMALLPLVGGFLDSATRLALLLAALFGFNFSRGISSCGWLPWITSLVPSSIRGRYLAIDAAFVNLASLLVFILAAFTLGSNPPEWRFAVLFGFSALMGAISLSFLKRIPDVEPPPEEKTSRQPVPWGAIVEFIPFQRLLWFAVAWAFAYGGVTVFIVAFLKHLGAFTEQQIMLITATTFIGALSSLGMLGERLDRLGSKPVLMVAQLLGLLMLVGWTLVAGAVIKPGVIFVSLLTMVAGLSGAVVQMANTRLVMAIAPKMGRSHFFALFSVVSNVSLGIAPLFWGLLIDLNRQTQVRAAGLEWNRFTLFFAAAAGVMGVAILVCRRLQEPQASGMETLLKEVLIDSPQRLVLRLLHRG
ncbi:MAG: MFS transporter [Verrucomicrobiales bacterium]|nr:MFS transporter [Verrucomicrobiales bacterium]